MLSFIIPYHNEGREFIAETVRQIRETIDINDYEIIIVDDGSAIPLPSTSLGGRHSTSLGGRVTVKRHDINMGVGAAFDTGVKIARGEDLFLMGADIRFIKNGWASKMLEEVNRHPKAFTCTTCVGLNTEDPINMDIVHRRNVLRCNGATMLIFHDHKSNPKVGETFRGIIEAKWLPAMPIEEDAKSFEIPCILGAAYGVKKAWYNYVDGWAGHRLWGTLEPYISLKSWLFGGSCRCARGIETGHIFKKHGTHGTPQEALMYNKMMVATMLFDDHDRLISFLGNNQVLDRARLAYMDNIDWIMQKRKEYKAKTVVSMEALLERFSIDYRRSHESRVTPEFIKKECDFIYSNASNAYNKHWSGSPYINVWNEAIRCIDTRKKIIDIGCGVGQFMDMLLDNGLKDYAGFDISPVAIGKASERLSKHNGSVNASVRCANMLEEQMPDGDVYVFMEILEHLSQDLQLLARVPEGKKIILSVPSFLGGSHVRKFDSVADVVKRYGVMLEGYQVKAIAYGSGTIFLMTGIKR